MEKLFVCEACNRAFVLPAEGHKVCPVCGADALVRLGVTEVARIRRGEKEENQ